MWIPLMKLSKNLVLAIPVMLAAGFLFGLLADASAFKALIMPFTFLMVYPMMITLKVREVFKAGDAKAQWLTQTLNFGIIPFLAFGLGMAFFPGQPGMVLASCWPGWCPPRA